MLNLELGVNPNATARMKTSDLRKFTVNTIYDGPGRSSGSPNCAMARARTYGRFEAYKHISPGERLETVRAALKAGRVKGQIADMYFSLKVDVHDVFLEEQLQAVHVTPLGRCEALVEQVCLAEGSAQRLGIDPVEFSKPLPLPDRTLPRGGYKRRPHPSR